MRIRRLGLGCVPILLAVILPGAHRAAAQITNAARISGLTQSGKGWELDWQPGPTGTAYTVQFQDSLQDGIWRLPMSPAPFPLDTDHWLDTARTNASRFYRVVAVPAARRGRVLSSTLQEMLSKAELSSLFGAAGEPVNPQYSVRLYKVVYETIDAWGGRTQASGALVLPEGTGGPLPLVSYQHGTIIQTNDAPSSMNLQGEISVGMAFAMTGYAAALPDYLGLGASPGLHPYLHAASEASACLDMLRAVRWLCSTNGFPLSGKLFLCGYSQGGHATLALLREIETHATGEFTVTACAAMAGPYDLSGIITADFLSGGAQPNPYYFGYLLAAYQEVYHFAPSLAAILAPPYDTTLPPLLYGNAGPAQLNSAMPSDPAQILKPDYLNAFKANPRHPLRLALEDNDVYAWKPLAPLRLYHCAGDQDVLIAYSQVAYETFQALGATQVQLIDPLPSADHDGCALPSLLAAEAWFDSLK
jgi:Secretory lipase